MLLVILLDWSDPWNWVIQLRGWIRLLHTLLRALPPETIRVLQENIVEWRDNKRNDFKDTATSTGDASSNLLDADVTLPLGPGEWDTPLGVPLCVVCQNANLIDVLEKESGWKDRHFDFVQQFVRTILLKHGSSLIYTMPPLAGSESALQRLVHSSLSIRSMLQKQTLKHNTTNRDAILVPPNFDSWGKIRILTDDFDVEAVSEAWTRAIEADAVSEIADGQKSEAKSAADDAVTMYEEVIKNAQSDGDIPGLPQKQKAGSGLEIEGKDTQIFLSEQAALLEGLSREDERSQQARESKKTLGPSGAGDVEEHIGPVQFNMGGIQMDAEDMVKRLKVSNSSMTKKHKRLTRFRIARQAGRLNQSAQRRHQYGQRMRRWRMRS
jgi:dynein light intermediate chain 1, cytosolic